MRFKTPLISIILLSILFHLVAIPAAYHARGESTPVNETQSPKKPVENDRREVQTSTVEETQSFGGSQSADDARIAVFARVKRKVLMEAALRLEKFSSVRDAGLTKDEIFVLATGLFKPQVISQKNYYEDNAFAIKVSAEVKIDKSNIGERVKKLLDKSKLLKKWEFIQEYEKKVLAGIEALEKRNRRWSGLGSPPDEEKKEFEKLKRAFGKASRKLTASALFKKALALWGSKSVSDVNKIIRYLEGAIRLDPNHSDSYEYIGLMCNDRGRYNLAIKYYKKALQVSLEKTKVDNTRLVSIYNGMGRARDRKGEYGGAVEYYKKALKINLKLLGPDHPDTVKDYNKIGLALYENGEYENALKYYKKALKVDSKTSWQNHPELAILYNDIGSAFYTKGKYDKAIKYWQKTLKIKLKRLGVHHTELIDLHTDIGAAWFGKGEYDNALKYYKKALSQALREGKNLENPRAAGLYSRIGLVHDYKSEYAKAIESYKKALKLEIKRSGEKHPDVLSLYDRIGSAYNSRGEYDTAIKYWQKAMKKQPADQGPQNTGEQVDAEILSKTIHKNNKIGAAYYSKGEYHKAVEHWREALSGEIKRSGEEHVDTAIMHNKVGSAYKGEGKYDEAAEHFKEAVKITDKILGKKHPYTRRFEKNLKSVE